MLHASSPINGTSYNWIQVMNSLVYDLSLKPAFKRVAEGGAVRNEQPSQLKPSTDPSTNVRAYLNSMAKDMRAEAFHKYNAAGQIEPDQNPPATQMSVLM